MGIVSSMNEWRKEGYEKEWGGRRAKEHATKQTAKAHEPLTTSLLLFKPRRRCDVVEHCTLRAFLLVLSPTPLLKYWWGQREFPNSAECTTYLARCIGCLACRRWTIRNNCQRGIPNNLKTGNQSFTLNWHSSDVKRWSSMQFICGID